MLELELLSTIMLTPTICLTKSTIIKQSVMLSNIFHCMLTSARSFCQTCHFCLGLDLAAL